MAITFALRGDSLTPRYNGTGGPGYGAVSVAGTPVWTVANASAIGGTCIDLGHAGVYQQHHVHYNGVGNWPTTIACSVLVRVAFYSLTNPCGMWMCAAAGRHGSYGQGSLAMRVDSTNIQMQQGTDLGGTGIAAVDFAHGGLTAGTAVSTFYDIVMTFTGDATANGCTVYLDGSSLGSTTGAAWGTSPRIENFRDLVIGASYNLYASYQQVNELVIWDEVIDPTNVTLTSGAGSLNGASRTAFVDVTATDGSAGGGLKRHTTAQTGVT